jgi:hypothetical protein
MSINASRILNYFGGNVYLEFLVSDNGCLSLPYLYTIKVDIKNLRTDFESNSMGTDAVFLRMRVFMGKGCWGLNPAGALMQFF